jgi:hypothetical protein
VTGVKRHRARAASIFTFKSLLMPMIEIAFGTYMCICAIISIIYSFGRGSVPFLLIFAGGYFYVGVGSIFAMWKMHQEAREETLLQLAAPPVEPTVG